MSKSALSLDAAPLAVASASVLVEETVVRAAS
jgi:hypothetical protein